MKIKHKKWNNKKALKEVCGDRATCNVLHFT